MNQTKAAERVARAAEDTAKDIRDAARKVAAASPSQILLLADVFEVFASHLRRRANG